MNRPNRVARLVDPGKRTINGETDYVAVYRLDNCGHTRTEIFRSEPLPTRKLYCYACREEEALSYGS